MKSAHQEPIQRTTHEQRRERRRQMAADVKSGEPYAAVAYKFRVTESHVRQACREFEPEFEKPVAKPSRKKKGR